MTSLFQLKGSVWVGIYTSWRKIGPSEHAALITIGCPHGRTCTCL